MDRACVRPQKQYRSDLNWMKGVGWEASVSLDAQQAKKAGELVSEVTCDPVAQNALLRSAAGWDIWE